MNTSVIRSYWILLLIFCCICLPERMAFKGATIDTSVEHTADEECKDNVEKEDSRRYLKIYIDEDSCIIIDMALVIVWMVLLFAIVLVRTVTV